MWFVLGCLDTVAWVWLLVLWKGIHTRIDWDLGTGRTFLTPSRWWFGGIGTTTTILVYWVFLVLNWVDQRVEKWTLDTIRDVGEVRWDAAETAYYYFVDWKEYWWRVAFGYTSFYGEEEGVNWKKIGWIFRGMITLVRVIHLWWVMNVIV